MTRSRGCRWGRREEREDGEKEEDEGKFGTEVRISFSDDRSWKILMTNKKNSNLKEAFQSYHSIGAITQSRPLDHE